MPLKQLVNNTISILLPAERRRLYTLILLDVCINIADILSLALLLYIVNLYTSNSPAGQVAFLPHWLTDRHSLLPITLFLLLFSAKNLAGFLVYRAQSRFTGKVASRISQNNLLNYLQGPYDAYVNVDSAVHIRSISHSPIDFCQHIVGGMQQIITQTLLILLSIIAIGIFNARLFLLLFLLLLPPVIIVFYLVKQRLHAARTNAKSSIERALQHLQEALSGFVESNIYNRNPEFLRRYISWQAKFNEYASDMVIVQGIPGRMIEIFALLGFFILVAIYQWWGGPDNTAIITIGAFMAAAYKIIPGIVKVLNASGQIGAWKYTVHELLAAGKATDQAENIQPASPVRCVQFEQVSFQYGNRQIIRKLNMTLERGDFLGISGPSGQGKTTIMNLLLGFLHPQSGSMLINHRPVAGEQCRRFWPQIAYVKQQPFLLHDTLLFNITLYSGAPDQQKLKAVINATGLDALISTLPDGLHTMITENGKNISGGQRQRIVIARAMYKDANLFLLDEPFNELDSASENCLLQHFQQMAAAGKMIVFITHHKKSLSYCNKIISLDGH